MNEKMLPIFFLFVIVLSFSSCNSKRETRDGSSHEIEAKLNDSLSIKIYLDDQNRNFSGVIIKNATSKINHIYWFNDDGITPVIVGRDSNGVRIGHYYTYFGNGRLNNSIYYVNGKAEGEWDIYSEDGKIIYKAYYENGVEKKVEINDTPKPFLTKSEIAPVKEEHK